MPKRAYLAKTNRGQMLGLDRPQMSSAPWWWTTRGGHRHNPSGQGGEEQRRLRLQAVLFLAREPLNTRKLSQLANLADGTEARTLVNRLNEQYDAAERAFRIEEVAGGMQLRTRRKYGRWLRRLTHVPTEVRLSAPSMETLAVVAYRQPVVRAEIEAIRGVSCGEILRQLMERDLVRVVGRSEELGRPFYYGTTRRFLQLFGMRHLDELPRTEILRESGANLTIDEQEPGNAGSQFHNEEGVRDVSYSIENDIESLSTAIEEPIMNAAGAVVIANEADDDDWDDDEEEFDDDEEDDDDFDDDDEEDDDDEDWEEVEDEEFEDEEFEDEEFDDEDEEFDDDDEEEEEEDEDWEEVEDEEFDDEEDEDDDDWDDDEEEEEEDWE